jgi:aminoglycoside phosphotransferase family enzyme
VKKLVSFGFLDFSTFENRYFMLRLLKRDQVKAEDLDRFTRSGPIYAIK